MRRDLKNKTFGRLTARENTGSKNNRRMWLCDCSCGNTIVVSSNALLRGNTKSCGCLKHGSTVKRNKVLKEVCINGHELSGDNLYVSPKGTRQCRACKEEYKEKHPSKITPAKQAEYRKNQNDRNPDYFANKHLERHGLSLEKYDQMLAEQGGGCALCHEPPMGQRLHVDHDHSCCPGQYACEKCVRGLLCQKCNHALGLLKENLDVFAAAIEYLKKGGTR